MTNYSPHADPPDAQVGTGLPQAGEGQRSIRSRVHVTQQDVEFFREKGYWIYHHQLFPAHKFDKLRATFERILDERPEGKRPEDLDVPHFKYTELFEWLLADEALDLVEPFIGPDIALWSSHFICKPPGMGRAVAWHEDSAYWKGLLDPQEVATVWLAIDDSTVENGCMRVIPGSHSHGFSDYEPVNRDTHVFGSRIKPGQFDESQAVDLEIRSGECHLHHAKMIHGSTANTSNRRRCGYTMRYMSTNVKFIRNPQRMKHVIYLARGKDYAGNNYWDTGKPYVEGVR